MHSKPPVSVGILICLGAAAGYALLELAYFGQRNHLLPWAGEHASLFLTFLALHGAVALGVWWVSRFASRVFFSTASLPLFAPIGALLAIHAITWFRERKYSLPRDVFGTAVTLGIALAFVVLVFGAARLFRGQPRRAAVAAGFAALLLVLVGGYRVATVEPRGRAVAAIPRAASESIVATSTGQRVFVFGIDGITWDVLDPLMAQGRMPNLAAVAARGRTFDLETIRPTYSPVIWTSIATGKSRFQHGIHDVVQTILPGGTQLPRSLGRTAFYTKTTGVFFRFLSSRGLLHLSPYRSHEIRATSVFEVASEAELSSSQIEWYVSWPARPLSGVTVSDRFHLQADGSFPDVVSPPALAPVLADHIVTGRDVPVERVMEFVDTEGLDARGASEWAREQAAFVEEMRLNLARDLTTRNVAVDLLSRDREWRLFGVYFRAVDLSHHLTWRFRGADGDVEADPELRLGTVIERYHEFVDRLVGEVLAEVPAEAVVLLLSDHGFEDRYSHSRAPDGFAILAGGATVPSSERGRIGIYEIAPTVAALLGLPVAEDLVAEARVDLIDPALLASHPLRRVSTWEREDRESGGTGLETDPAVEDAEIDRLRALGYIQ